MNENEFSRMSRHHENIKVAYQCDTEFRSLGKLLICGNLYNTNATYSNVKEILLWEEFESSLYDLLQYQNYMYKLAH